MDELSFEPLLGECQADRAARRSHGTDKLRQAFLYAVWTWPLMGLIVLSSSHFRPKVQVVVICYLVVFWWLGVAHVMAILLKNRELLKRALFFFCLILVLSNALISRSWGVATAGTLFMFICKLADTLWMKLWPEHYDLSHRPNHDRADRNHSFLLWAWPLLRLSLRRSWFQSVNDYQVADLLLYLFYVGGFGSFFVMIYFIAPTERLANPSDLIPTFLLLFWLHIANKERNNIPLQKAITISTLAAFVPLFALTWRIASTDRLIYFSDVLPALFWSFYIILGNDEWSIGAEDTNEWICFGFYCCLVVVVCLARLNRWGLSRETLLWSFHQPFASNMSRIRIQLASSMVSTSPANIVA